VTWEVKDWIDCREDVSHSRMCMFLCFDLRVSSSFTLSGDRDREPAMTLLDALEES
jgi:hypothetical protein